MQKAVVKLLAVHTFNYIAFRVKFGLTSYEELLPALANTVQTNVEQLRSECEQLEKGLESWKAKYSGLEKN